MLFYGRFLVAAMALLSVSTANAAYVHKRQLDSKQECVSGVNSLIEKVSTLKISIDAIGVFNFITAAPIAFNNQASLSVSLGQVTTTCCAINGPVSETNAQTLAPKLDAFAPVLKATMSSLSSKSNILAGPFGAAAINLILTDFQTASNKLATCLIKNAPAEYITKGEAVKQAINAAFGTAEQAYTNDS